MVERLGPPGVACNQRGTAQCVKQQSAETNAPCTSGSAAFDRLLPV